MSRFINCYKDDLTEIDDDNSFVIIIKMLIHNSANIYRYENDKKHFENKNIYLKKTDIMYKK